MNLVLFGFMFDGEWWLWDVVEKGMMSPKLWGGGKDVVLVRYIAEVLFLRRCVETGSVHESAI